MEVKVTLSNIRIAPLKTRRVVDMIRGKKVGQAQALLTYTIGKASLPILKLLNSAIATAKNDFKLNEEELFIAKATVDEGPKLKRFHPMSRGRAFPILKRTSNIVITLGELKDAPVKMTKKEKGAARRLAKMQKTEKPQEAPKAEKKPAARKPKAKTK
jgi:large subunit ribosomal protein L22